MNCADPDDQATAQHSEPRGYLRPDEETESSGYYHAEIVDRGQERRWSKAEGMCMKMNGEPGTEAQKPEEKKVLWIRRFPKERK